jgi:hypothetical protein
MHALNLLITLVAVAALVAGIAPQAANATPITVPTGLNPGDEYRLVFVTSTTRDATSSNIEDYNAFVTTAANSVPELLALSTTWKAIASTATVDARDNTNTNFDVIGVDAPLYLLNDTMLAGDFGLWFGAIQAAISTNEFGVLDPLLPQLVWTGTNSFGVALNPLGSGGPQQGSPLTSNWWWIEYVTFDLAPEELPLYAISGTLTVVPEPSTASLLALGLVGIAAARRQNMPLRTCRGNWL